MNIHEIAANYQVTQAQAAQAAAAAAAAPKVYRALLSQTGTNAPIATVLENTLGGEVVWSRVDTGIYSGVLAGAFTANRTFLLSEPDAFNGYTHFQQLVRASENEVNLYTLQVNNTPQRVNVDIDDGGTPGTSVQISVYPA